MLKPIGSRQELTCPDTPVLQIATVTPITLASDDFVGMGTATTGCNRPLAGLRAFIERRLVDRITVIMLINGGDTNRMAINDSIQRVLKAAASEEIALPFSLSAYDGSSAS
jgi:hypothetical protein